MTRKEALAIAWAWREFGFSSTPKAEQDIRTAINRIYYGTMTYCRVWMGFSLEDGNYIHRNIPDYARRQYKDNGAKSFRLNFKDLKYLRVQADYKFHADVTQAMLEKAKALSDAIIQEVSHDRWRDVVSSRRSNPEDYDAVFVQMQGQLVSAFKTAAVDFQGVAVKWTENDAIDVLKAPFSELKALFFRLWYLTLDCAQQGQVKKAIALEAMDALTKATDVYFSAKDVFDELAADYYDPRGQRAASDEQIAIL